MIALEIEDVKAFMSIFLMKESFDSLAVQEIELQTSCHYYIEGSYMEDWWEDTEDKPIVRCGNDTKRYLTWGYLRSNVFSLIKGKQSPTLMRVVLLASESLVEKLLVNTPGYRMEDVLSLGMRVQFEQGHLQIVSGCTIQGFRMDKELEHAWDCYLSEQFKSFSFSFEKIIG